MKNLLVKSAITAVISLSACGYGTGQSSYPLLPEKKLVGAEFTGITSTGGGVGVQGRYTQKINSKIVFDAGLGISGGERDSRFFLGTDYELFPDYMNQPRVSIRFNYENAKEFDVRRSILSIAPTVSKGFSFWGTEAFPFFSLPVGINLDGDSKTYESQINANFGVTGNIPLKGYKHLIGTIEGSIKVKDSYTGIFASISYPIN
jgi:hypothetical protein